MIAMTGSLKDFDIRGNLIKICTIGKRCSVYTLKIERTHIQLRPSKSGITLPTSVTMPLTWQSLKTTMVYVHSYLLSLYDL